jgi:hypothetical protein
LIKLCCERIILSHWEDSTITDALTTLSRLIENQDIAQAQEFWISQKDLVSDYIYWHNLGVTQRLKGELPLARFSFEKASLHSVYSLETHRQLQEVVHDLGLSKSSMPWGIGLDFAPVKLWLLLILLSMGILICIKLVVSRLLKYVIMALSLVPLLFAIWYQVKSIGFVLTAPVTIYDGPSDLFVISYRVNPGEKLVGFRQENWMIVYDTRREKKWLKIKDLKQHSLTLWGTIHEL